MDNAVDGGVSASVALTAKPASVDEWLAPDAAVVSEDANRTRNAR